MDKTTTKKTNDDPAYRNLYRFGGIAAFIAGGAVFFEVIFLAFYPQPGSVVDWFKLMNDNPIIAILDFWALEIILYLMLIVVFLALFMILQKTGPSLILIAATLAFIGIGVFLATNNPFSMLSLSHQYAMAQTEQQRLILLSAGETILACTGQRAVNGFNSGLFLVSISGLLFSLTMQKHPAFSGTPARVGNAAYAFALADFLRQTLTSSPVVVLLLVIPNALLLIAWLVIVGRKLLRLGQES